MKRVLITGASGFVGKELANELSKKYKVRVFIRNSAKAKFGKKFEIVYGDLSNIQSLKKAVKDVDVIYHLAAILPNAKVGKNEFYNVNVIGTKNLFNVANTSSTLKQFIHCSTSYVGWGNKPFTNEEGKCCPETIYEKTKYEGEKIATSFIGRSHFPITIVRPGLIYNEYSPFLYRIFKTLQNKNFFYIGTGQNYFELIHIKDLIKFFKIILLNPKAYNELFIVSEKKPLKFKEIIDISSSLLHIKSPKRKMPKKVFEAIVLFESAIKKMIGRNIFLSKDTFKTLTRDRAFNTQKSYRILGYSTTANIKNELALAVKKFNDNYSKQ